MKEWPSYMPHKTTPLHNLPVNIKHVALEAVAQHKKKNPRVTLSAAHASLARILGYFLLYGERPQHTIAVFQQGPPVSWHTEDRREQRDCQSNASLRYSVSLDLERHT